MLMFTGFSCEGVNVGDGESCIDFLLMDDKA